MSTSDALLVAHVVRFAQASDLPYPRPRSRGARAQDADKLYTFALTDPDAPNPTEPKFAEWVHWLSVNRSAAGAGGDDLVAFFGSAPGNGAGVHRYVLVVYEQTAAIVDAAEPRIPLRRCAACGGNVWSRRAHRSSVPSRPTDTVRTPSHRTRHLPQWLPAAEEL